RPGGRVLRQLTSMRRSRSPTPAIPSSRSTPSSPHRTSATRRGGNTRSSSPTSSIRSWPTLLAHPSMWSIRMSWRGHAAQADHCRPSSPCSRALVPMPPSGPKCKLARHPAAAHLPVALLHGRPGNAVGDLLDPVGLTAAVGLPGMLEGVAKDILGMRRKASAHGLRQIIVARVGHGGTPRIVSMLQDEPPQRPAGCPLSGPGPGSLAEAGRQAAHPSPTRPCHCRETARPIEPDLGLVVPNGKPLSGHRPRAWWASACSPGVAAMCYTAFISAGFATTRAASRRSRTCTCVKLGELALDRPTLAKIFWGEISKWDDPALDAQPECQTAPCRPAKRNGLHRGDLIAQVDTPAAPPKRGSPSQERERRQCRPSGDVP